MKSLQEYCNEQSLKNACIEAMNESSNEIIKLPYTFDIYNEGPKNKDYKITKANIHKIYLAAGRREEFDKKTGKKMVTFIGDHSEQIRLPLPANHITYKYFPDKENTKNWTEVPELMPYTWAGAWYSDKYVEYNYREYNKDWNEWFNAIKPYMKGKISVTMQESGHKSHFSKELELVVNDERFNKEREERMKAMRDPSNLKKWAEYADAKEKAEIKKRKEEEERKKKAEEEWDKWWNSMTDEERLIWTMGYGRGSGNWTGD